MKTGSATKIPNQEWPSKTTPHDYAASQKNYVGAGHHMPYDGAVQGCIMAIVLAVSDCCLLVNCMGNPQIFLAIPGPVPVNYPYPHGGYGFCMAVFIQVPKIHIRTGYSRSDLPPFDLLSGFLEFSHPTHWPFLMY